MISWGGGLIPNRLYVVEGAHDNRAPGGEEHGLNPLTVQGQKHGDRNPDDKSPEHRHDRQESHDHTPKQRSGQSQPPEH